MIRLKYAFMCIALVVGSTRAEIDTSRVLNKIGAQVASLDPAQTCDDASNQATSLIMEPLLVHSSKPMGNLLIPAAAESWSLSDDGLVYTFNLRKDAVYHDNPCFPEGKGRSVKAQDFVFAWKRLVDPRVSSPGSWMVRDIVKGLKTFSARAVEVNVTDYSIPVEGLRAIDDFTFQVELIKPYKQFIWFVSMIYSSPVPAEAIEYYGSITENPVGAGPYYLGSWHRTYKRELKLNHQWHGWKNVDFDADVVPFETINHLVIQDPSTQWLMFLKGEIDILAQIDRDNFETVIDASMGKNTILTSRGITSHSAPTLNIYYLGLNHMDPILQNKKLRQALNAAFDLDRWITFHNGRVKELLSPTPPHLKGALNEPFPYSFDLERAKRLMVEAGYPNGIDPKTGKRIVLTLELGNATQSGREAAELTAAFLSEIGIDMQISFNQWPAFLAKVAENKAQMFATAWCGDYPDIENFMQLFLARNANPGPNRCNYNNPEVDVWYDKATSAKTEAEEIAAWHKVQHIIREDCPWLFQHYGINFALVGKRILNYQLHDFPCGMERYWRVRVRK